AVEDAVGGQLRGRDDQIAGPGGLEAARRGARGDQRAHVVEIVEAELEALRVQRGEREAGPEPFVADRLHGPWLPRSDPLATCAIGLSFLRGEGAVAEPVARPGAEAGGAVVGVRQFAAVERKAAAADALGEARLQPLQLRDPLVDPAAPGGREARPVAARGDAVRGQLGELGGDLLEAEADPLGEDNEGDPAEDRARIAAVAGALALG